MLLRNGRFVPVLPSRVYKSHPYTSGGGLDNDGYGAIRASFVLRGNCSYCEL